jgi:hypothetical protein
MGGLGNPETRDDQDKGLSACELLVILMRCPEHPGSSEHKSRL